MTQASSHNWNIKIASALLAGALAIVPSLQAQADSGILAAFQSFYPNSSSDENSGVKGCQLCHEKSTKPTLLNHYAWLLKKSNINFSLLESYLSVNINGGTTMLDEINAGTQPGWTSGANNNVYTFTNLNDPISQTYMPPDTIIGELDPTVTNTPPTADPNGPYTGVTGVAVTFDGSGSSDTDGSITTYDWDFGDGNTGTGMNPAHAYTSAGDFTVTLTVTDDDGDPSPVATTTATISQPPATTFLAPGWHASNFLALAIPSRAIAFDSDRNLYIEDTGDDNSGEIEVLQLTTASGYKDSSSFATYTTSYKGATGLGFDGLGSLYVAERDADGDAGIIREINVATQTLAGDVMAFENHRPTGVDADTSSNVFYSGRKESAGTWGKIFQIDTTIEPAVRTELILETVATGIAVDTSGNIFISTPQRDDLPLLRNSIYRFAANDLLNPELIATFDAPGEELTFDTDGNLYMVADNKLSIIKLSLSSSRALPWVPLLLE